MNHLHIFSKQLVGQRLVWIREQHNLNQKDFAKSLGISTSKLSQWENGKYMLSLRSAVQITIAYDVSLDFLFLGKTEMISTDLKSEVARQVIANSGEAI